MKWNLCLHLSELLNWSGRQKRGQHCFPIQTRLEHSLKNDRKYLQKIFDRLDESGTGELTQLGQVLLVCKCKWCEVFIVRQFVSTHFDAHPRLQNLMDGASFSAQLLVSPCSTVVHDGPGVRAGKTAVQMGTLQ